MKMIEREDDEEADDEFMSLMQKPNVGEVMVATDPFANRIARGLRM